MYVCGICGGWTADEAPGAGLFLGFVEDIWEYIRWICRQSGGGELIFAKDVDGGEGGAGVEGVGRSRSRSRWVCRKVKSAAVRCCCIEQFTGPKSRLPAASLATSSR